MRVTKNSNVYQWHNRMPTVEIRCAEMAVLFLTTDFGDGTMMRDHDSFSVKRLAEFTLQKVQRDVISLNHICWAQPAETLRRPNNLEIIHQRCTRHRRCKFVARGCEISPGCCDQKTYSVVNPHLVFQDMNMGAAPSRIFRSV
jgi:hypothetical protein